MNELVLESPDDTAFEISDSKKEKLLETGAIYWSEEFQIYFLTEKMFTPSEVRLLMNASEE